jgi:hypothetical protein
MKSEKKWGPLTTSELAELIGCEPAGIRRHLRAKGIQPKYEKAVSLYIEGLYKIKEAKELSSTYLEF